MKKKLSIVMYSMAGGGAERVVAVLLEELRVDFEVSLVLMKKKIDYDVPQDIKVFFLEDSNPNENGILKLLKLPVLAWKYKNFCQQNNIDISMSFTTRPTYFSIFSKWLGNRCHIIINESTTPSMMYQGKGLVARINKSLIRHLYPHAHKIIANSEGGKIDLIQNFNIEESLITTIYNPCDLEMIKHKSHEKVNIFQEDTYNFISAGRLDSGKNHQLLIRAFAKINNKKSHLYILGEGSLKTLLEALINDLSLTSRVTLLGFDSNPYKYFSQADTFVFASNYEGFPVVLIEALTCGLPMISTDCKSGPRELLSPSSEISKQIQRGVEIGEFGILTPIGEEKMLTEAMNKMCEDEVLRDEYKIKSQLRIKSFDKVNIVPLFINILKQSEDLK